jgi:hypothetical protein
MVSRMNIGFTQQNDYFIAKSQPYALAHCSRELQNLEAHEQNVRSTLSLSITHTESLQE